MDEKFTLLLCPCNQFLKQEPDPPDVVESYMSAVFGLADGGSYMISQKVKVNRVHTSTLYKYLKRYSDLWDEGEECARPIPWNFAKFIVAANGTIRSYTGPTHGPLSLEPQIRELLQRLKTSGG